MDVTLAVAEEESVVVVQMGQYHLFPSVVDEYILVAVVVAEEYFLEAVEQEELVHLLPIQRVKEGVREVGEAQL